MYCLLLPDVVIALDQAVNVAKLLQIQGLSLLEVVLAQLARLDLDNFPYLLALCSGFYLRWLLTLWVLLLQ